MPMAMGRAGALPASGFCRGRVAEFGNFRGFRLMEVILYEQLCS